MHYLIYSVPDSPGRTLSSPSLLVFVSFLILSLLNLHVWVFFLYLCLHHVHAGTCTQRPGWIPGIGVTDSVHCHVGAGNWTGSSGRSDRAFSHWAVSLAPNTSSFKIQIKSMTWGYCCNSFKFCSEGAGAGILARQFTTATDIYLWTPYFSKALSCEYYTAPKPLAVKSILPQSP